MLWLTWRQYRSQLLATGALLALGGALLLVNGRTAAGVVRDTLAAAPGSPSHARLTGRVGELFGMVSETFPSLAVAPVVIGLFWGAPLLAKEFEAGTHRLAWTQSVPRARWLGTKLSMLALLVTLGGLAQGLMVTAWLGAYDGVATDSPFTNNALFGLSGVVPMGWWLFAFAAGTAVGSLTRRLLPAMAVTAAVVAVALGLIGSVAREHYAEPERHVQHGATSIGTPPGSLVVGTAWVTADGAERPAAPMHAPDGPCPGVSGTTAAMRCARGLGYEPVVYTQPAGRYWRFQWTELGLLALGAAAFGALAVRRVARAR